MDNKEIVAAILTAGIISKPDTLTGERRVGSDAIRAAVATYGSVLAHLNQTGSSNDTLAEFDAEHPRP